MDQSLRKCLSDPLVVVVNQGDKAVLRIVDHAEFKSGTFVELRRREGSSSTSCRSRPPPLADDGRDDEHIRLVTRSPHGYCMLSSLSNAPFHLGFNDRALGEMLLEALGSGLKSFVLTRVTDALQMYFKVPRCMPLVRLHAASSHDISTAPHLFEQLISQWDEMHEEARRRAKSLVETTLERVHAVLHRSKAVRSLLVSRAPEDELPVAACFSAARTVR